MLIRRITDLGMRNPRLLASNVLYAHTSLCLTKKPPVCPGSGKAGGGGSGLMRAEKSGPCRYGFIPEEWFLFFHSKTGVSGPYVFGLVVANYLFSKEIYVMEHEFYSGLSFIPVLYFVTTRLGPGIGASLDKEVDAIADAWEKGRQDEIEFHEEAVKDAKDAQWRAEGQKLLMDAKKENIAMQLEAAYRERYMHVYRSVKGRMDYHMKKYRAEARVQQKWMIGWILENVNKSITPEFQKQALDSAVRDLSAAASRVT